MRALTRIVLVLWLLAHAGGFAMPVAMAMDMDDEAHAAHHSEPAPCHNMAEEAAPASLECEDADGCCMAGCAQCPILPAAAAIEHAAQTDGALPAVATGHASPGSAPPYRPPILLHT